MQSDPGIHVTGYRIEARIGRGGMGEVYRAEQLNLGRKVALKVLRPDLRPTTASGAASCASR